MVDAFRRHQLDGVEPFAELFASVAFEDAGQGRQGAVLVQPDAAGAAPIVRTTTRYLRPAQCFRPVHQRLARRIQETAAVATAFNNALVEVYTNAYTTMGAHSDQAQDLEAGSEIALYSCYEHPDRRPRKLLVEPKDGAAGFEVPLAHGSVVVFSLDANRRHRHRIVLQGPAPDNRWLGFTFRTSRTFVSGARFADGTPLTLADEEQRRALYQLRGRENREPDFTWPRLTCTISESDLLPPTWWPG